MKTFINCISIILFPFLTFSQWTEIVPTGKIILINSIHGEQINLIKLSDSISFVDWKKDLKLNGMPDQGFNSGDFSILDLIDSSKLSQAYDAACVNCPLKWSSSPQATIEFPETQFLYRGYDNVFKLAANWPDGVKEYRIEATDATVKNITQNNQILHTINPKGKTSEVRVIYKDIDGFEQEFGPWVYRVRVMPKPLVSTDHISKSMGGRIRVILPPDFMIGGVDFQVNKIEVNGNTSIDGDIISPELLKKIKVGKRISLIVTAINLTTEEEVVINSLIEVVK